MASRKHLRSPLPVRVKQDLGIGMVCLKLVSGCFQFLAKLSVIVNLSD